MCTFIPRGETITDGLKKGKIKIFKTHSTKIKRAVIYDSPFSFFGIQKNIASDTLAISFIKKLIGIVISGFVFIQ